MSYRNLVIIDNEKISKKNNSFYCDNFEAKISEDLNQGFVVTVIARKSKINRARQINLEKIETASNIFSFLFSIFKTFKQNKTNYLIISINPYTFFFLFVSIHFQKKNFCLFKK